MRDLAEYLKSERLERGLTLDDISRQMSLSKYVLRAIEEGAFEKIGPPLLIRRFVSFYCSALGIDSKQLLEKYAEAIDSIDLQGEGIERYTRMRHLFGKKKKWRPMAFLLYVAAAALVIYGGIFLYEKRQSVGSLQFLRTEGYPQLEIPSDLSEGTLSIHGGERGVNLSEKEDGSLLEEEAAFEMAVETGGEKEHGEGSSGELVSSGEMLQNDLPSLETVESPESASRDSDFPPIASNGVVAPVLEDSELNRLTFHAVEKTWIQVSIDGTTIRSALMMPGESLDWTAKKSVQVVLGNARGVEMKWNGQSVNYPGKSGTVQRFTLPDPELMADE